MLERIMRLFEHENKPIPIIFSATWEDYEGFLQYEVDECFTRIWLWDHVLNEWRELTVESSRIRKVKGLKEVS